MRVSRMIRHVLIVSAFVLPTACGGAGGDSTTAAKPRQTPALQAIDARCAVAVPGPLPRSSLFQASSSALPSIVAPFADTMARLARVFTTARRDLGQLLYARIEGALVRGARDFGQSLDAARGSSSNPFSPFGRGQSELLSARSAVSAAGLPRCHAALTRLAAAATAANTGPA